MDRGYRQQPVRIVIEGRTLVALLLTCAAQMRDDRPLDEHLTAIQQGGFAGADSRWSTLADPPVRRLRAASALSVDAVYARLCDPGWQSRTAAERARARPRPTNRACHTRRECWRPKADRCPNLRALTTPRRRADSHCRHRRIDAIACHTQRTHWAACCLRAIVTIEPLDAAETQLLTNPAADVVKAVAQYGVLCAVRFSREVGKERRQGVRSDEQAKAVGETWDRSRPGPPGAIRNTRRLRCATDTTERDSQTRRW